MAGVSEKSFRWYLRSNEKISRAGLVLLQAEAALSEACVRSYKGQSVGVIEMFPIKLRA